MDPNNIKISAGILTKNDEQFIKGCIENISPYIDEIIILDANDNDNTKNIVDNMNIIVDNIKIDKKIIYKKVPVSQDFSKDRNILHSMASGDYILHIDCDERFDPIFLSSMRSIISNYINNHILPILFRFPRINKPNKVNYPDYQIRLVNKKYTKWIRKVHEIPEITAINKDDIKNLGIANTNNMITTDFPIIHLEKDKNLLQIRWQDLLSKDIFYNRKKLLVLSMFKNSDVWAKEVLAYINNAYKYNEKLDDNNPEKLQIYFSFLDGRSTDKTFEILKNFCEEGGILNIQLRQYDVDINPNENCARYKKLAIVRNYFVEQSVAPLSFKDDDYVLFIDSDIKFADNMIHELIKEMPKCQADMIAPMVYIEDFKWYGNSYFYDTLAFRSLNGIPFSHTEPYSPHLDMNRPNQLNSIGSFYIMKYKVAKNVKYSGNADSEQVEFCDRARSLGYQIFVTPRLSVYHINFEKYGMGWH